MQLPDHILTMAHWSDIGVVVVVASLVTGALLAKVFCGTTNITIYTSSQAVCKQQQQQQEALMPQAPPQQPAERRWWKWAGAFAILAFSLVLCANFRDGVVLATRGKLHSIENTTLSPPMCGPDAIVVNAQQPALEAQQLSLFLQGLASIGSRVTDLRQGLLNASYEVQSEFDGWKLQEHLGQLHEMEATWCADLAERVRLAAQRTWEVDCYEQQSWAQCIESTSSLVGEVRRQILSPAQTQARNIIKTVRALDTAVEVELKRMVSIRHCVQTQMKQHQAAAGAADDLFVAHFSARIDPTDILSIEWQLRSLCDRLQHLEAHVLAYLHRMELTGLELDAAMQTLDTPTLTLDRCGVLDVLNRCYSLPCALALTGPTPFDELEH
ncbi:hypothetical protein IWX47DRAFT_622845 [Phyllosticta citricarpa]